MKTRLYSLSIIILLSALILAQFAPFFASLTLSCYDTLPVMGENGKTCTITDSNVSLWLNITLTEHTFKITNRFEG